MDKVVGEAMGRLDDETLLFVVSDHGFTSFRRRFHLNSWLLENGYAALRDVFSQGEVNLFEDVNWKETRAYGLGINSLYLNLKGREPEGTVSPGDEAGALKAELVERLKALEDPKTGEKVVANVYRAEDVYSGPYVGAALDLVVGYNRNYRSSKETILGDFPERIIEDNDDPWSGDHCMDSALLPGVCFCNRKLAADQPTLADMAPTLFSAFGVPIPREMTGKNVLLA
jgi:predicted AlkP superfamily phosphohydrolase/phosphomutase